jgi:ketosteroid isomerase-like protein
MRSQDYSKTFARWIVSTLALVLILPAAGKAKPEAGPTAENAMAAEEALARAFRNNDADALSNLFDSSWAVITANGDVAEGPETFPSGIKSGVRTLKTFDMSEARVRLYGNVALITIKLDLAGEFGGKPFDVLERETDTWVWKDGRWKCVLTHESFVKHS